MDVLTDTMSTTQMQSKTGYVDSYDAMVEMERKMSDFKDVYAKGKAEKALQAAVKAEKALQAAVKAEDAIRRDAFYDAHYAKYKAEKALQAAVEAEKALQAAVEAEIDAYDEEDAIDKLFRKKINLMRARRDARHEFRKNHHV